MNKICIHCGDVLKTRHQVKFCSNKCQHDNQHAHEVNLWKNHYSENKDRFKTKNISIPIRKYLFNKFSERCSLCGWGERNPISGSIPLEVDHVDGNADNNEEGNLRLLCPNCHSLTPYFRNLNRGRGRKWRIERLNNINNIKS